MKSDFIRIELSMDVLSDFQGLYRVLEFYYLKGGHYELCFSRQHLCLVERAFDDLIFRYGILSSEFAFTIPEKADAAI